MEEMRVRKEAVIHTRPIDRWRKKTASCTAIATADYKSVEAVEGIETTEEPRSR